MKETTHRGAVVLAEKSRHIFAIFSFDAPAFFNSERDGDEDGKRERERERGR